MLRIRFSRTGKVGQPSYRIVVAEHRSPVKGRYIEMLGHYMPARNPKIVEIKKERVEHWIKMGAIPSDTAAALFKKEGMKNMERYLEPRDKKRNTKSEETKTETVPVKTPAAAAKAQAPAPTPATVVS